MADCKTVLLAACALLIAGQQQRPIGAAVRIGPEAGQGGAAAGALAPDAVDSAGAARKTSRLEKEFQENLADRIDNPLAPIVHDSDDVAGWQERLGRSLLADMQRIFYEPQRQAKLDNDNHPLLAVSAEAALVRLTHYALQLRGLAKADALMAMIKRRGPKDKAANGTQLVMSKNLMDILLKRTIWRSLMLGKPALERHMKRVHLLWRRYDDQPGVRAAIDTYYLRTSGDRLEPDAILEDMHKSWTFYNLELFKEGKDIDFEQGVALVDKIVDEVLPPVEILDQPLLAAPGAPADLDDRQRVLLEVYGEKYIVRDVLAVQMKIGAKLDPIACDEQALKSVSMNEVYTYEEIMFYPRSVSASDMRPSNELSKLILKRPEVIAPAPTL